MRSGLAVLALLLAACTLPAAMPATDVVPSLTATAAPSESATPSPTASPSPSTTATIPPTPDPAAMELEVTTCDGGTVLRWSPSRHPDFHHYIGLRSSEREIADQYPPIAPAVDWGDLYASDRFVTSGHDASLLPSDTEWHYRVIAYDADGRPVSRSNVASGRMLPPRELGEPTAQALPGGGVRLRWGRFDGPAECFSAYRVLYGTEVPGTLLTSISDPARVELETRALHPGVTYTLRVQAVVTTTLGHFTVGEAEPLSFTVPSSP